MKNCVTAVLLAVLVSMLSACTHTGAAVGTDREIESFDDSADAAPNPDPYESINRKIFVFNEYADRYFLKPVAKGYRWITPDPIEDGIGNMFSNVTEISVALNNVLQGKFKYAAMDGGRFLVNTTVGLAGFFDVAVHWGMPRHEEDFGQTLGYWGLNSGPYLVVPFLGPRTIRDGVGSIVDGYTDPVIRVDHVPTRNTLMGTRVVSIRAQLLKAEELVSGDRYIFLRDAYLQRRQFLVNDGVVEDNFGGEDYDDW